MHCNTIIFIPRKTVYGRCPKCRTKSQLEVLSSNPGNEKFKCNMRCGAGLDQQQHDHAFNPIGGLHHARRNAAGGFCVFNDIGNAIIYARKKYNLKKILYVDIDAHHGDGVYYEFEQDPDLIIADIHEDGSFLYPGTGFESENGLGAGKGSKLNLPLQPGATDSDFISAFMKIENFINSMNFELIIFQCGADGLSGDPLTHLRYTEKSHEYAAKALHRVAHDKAHGRIIGLGGGGYNKQNLAIAWKKVVESFATDQS